MVAEIAALWCRKVELHVERVQRMTVFVPGLALPLSVVELVAQVLMLLLLTLVPQRWGAVSVVIRAEHAFATTIRYRAIGGVGVPAFLWPADLALVQAIDRRGRGRAIAMVILLSQGAKNGGGCVIVGVKRIGPSSLVS